MLSDTPLSNKNFDELCSVLSSIYDNKTNVQLLNLYYQITRPSPQDIFHKFKNEVNSNLININGKLNRERYLKSLLNTVVNLKIAVHPTTYPHSAENILKNLLLNNALETWNKGKNLSTNYLNEVEKNFLSEYTSLLGNNSNNTKEKNILINLSYVFLEELYRAIVSKFLEEQLALNNPPEVTTLKSTKEVKISTTYRTIRWLGTNEIQIEALYYNLKSKALIALETDINTFKKAFSGEPQTKPIEIIWLFKDVDLAYFFEGLKAHQFISITIEYNSIVKTDRIFIDNNGKPFKNLKGAKNSYLNNKSEKPKSATLIDSILSKIPLPPFTGKE